MQRLGSTLKLAARSGEEGKIQEAFRQVGRDLSAKLSSEAAEIYSISKATSPRGLRDFAEHVEDLANEVMAVAKEIMASAEEIEKRK